MSGSAAAALERAGLHPSHVQEVIMGNVISAGLGQVIAAICCLPTSLIQAVHAAVHTNAVAMTSSALHCATLPNQLIFAAEVGLAPA